MLDIRVFVFPILHLTALLRLLADRDPVCFRELLILTLVDDGSNRAAILGQRPNLPVLESLAKRRR